MFLKRAVPVSLLLALACTPAQDERGFAQSIGIDWSIMEEQESGLLVGIEHAGSGPAAARG